MIKMLIDNGYKYMYIPSRNRKTFYATKWADNFYDDDTEYTKVEGLNDYEVDMLKILPKNSFIELSKLIYV